MEKPTRPPIPAGSIDTRHVESGKAGPTGNAPRPVKSDFKSMLEVLFAEGIHGGASAVTVRAADLHARVGGYPGRGHAMPTCCTAMREAMLVGDVVLTDVARGAGPALQIRYGLPR